MIELKNVGKTYRPRGIGLHGESVKIEEGEVVGILGANGSGKTTMLKAIMGLGDPRHGHVLINGVPPARQYSKMAFMTEEGSYFPDLTPSQYAEFLADFFPQFQMKQFHRFLTFFELNPDNKIKTFSKGQRSKLEICAGFSKGAKYMVMDEPFLGQDMLSRRDFLKLMVSRLKSDETVLLSTHIVDDIENIIDRAIILHKGKIKEDFYIDDMREEGKELTAVIKEIAGYKEGRINNLVKEGAE